MNHYKISWSHYNLPRSKVVNPMKSIKPSFSQGFPMVYGTPCKHHQPDNEYTKKIRTRLRWGGHGDLQNWKRRVFSSKKSMAKYLVGKSMEHLWILVGGIATHLKNMNSSVGMMKFPTEWESKIHLPNHQPNIVHQGQDDISWGKYGLPFVWRPHFLEQNLHAYHHWPIPTPTNNET